MIQHHAVVQPNTPRYNCAHHHPSPTITQSDKATTLSETFLIDSPDGTSPRLRVHTEAPGRFRIVSRATGFAMGFLATGAAFVVVGVVGWFHLFSAGGALLLALAAWHCSNVQTVTIDSNTGEMTWERRNAFRRRTERVSDVFITRMPCVVVWPERKREAVILCAPHHDMVLCIDTNPTYVDRYIEALPDALRARFKPTPGASARITYVSRF